MTKELFPKIERSYFPDPLKYDFPEWVLVGEFFYHAADVVAFGAPLTAETVLEAYSKGIFPWYMRGVPLPWYCPERRAILEFRHLHISRSLARARRQSRFTFTIDRDFESVIHGCATVKRADQGGTWITRDFVNVYGQLHREGNVHSVEVWNEQGELVGGLYGVDAGGVFCGESMFHRESNASKLALLFLIDQLRERGSEWLDCQVMTPHMRALGAFEVTRGDFLKRLRQTQQAGLLLFTDKDELQSDI